jgi:hypothetical protein
LAELAAEEDTTMAQVMSRFEREGLRKGVRQGRQEGRREERLALTLLLLEHRLGRLDEATAERVRALGDDQLLALYTAALDFSERQELERWLEGEAARG